MKITIVILLTLLTALLSPPAFASNRVLSLDGDGDYVEIAPNEKLNSINSQATIEAWIKAEASPKYWVLIIYKGDERKPNFSNRSYVLILFHFDCYDTLHLASAPSGRGNIWISSSHNLIKLNRWYHIAGVIDAKKNVIRMFINGVEAGSREFGDSIHVSALPLRIGWTHEDDSRYSSFAGQIDEVRIWRIARSQEEIQATMHTALSGKEPGLVGYWRFDDVGKIATDSSKYHSDGKLIGDAHFVEAEFPTSDETFVTTVLSGKITDEMGRPVVDTYFQLIQDERVVADGGTDTSGNYKVILGKVHGLYNLTVTQNNIDYWWPDIRLVEGEHQTFSPTLKKEVSIEGTILMLDNTTPHVAVVVQAILPPHPTLSPTGGRGEEMVIATTLSDGNGKYQFFNLMPDKYQVRCYTLDGYVYYRKPSNNQIQSRGDFGYRPKSDTEPAEGDLLHVEYGKTLKDIDFRLADFKKGTWKSYNALDGLVSNYLWDICPDPNGIIWIGAYGGGVSMYDGKNFSNFTIKDGLASQDVRAIYCDPDGVMWFGTEDGGVSRYDGKEFLNLTSRDGLASNRVIDIYRAPDGVMWFGTTECISRYEDSPHFEGGVRGGKRFVNFTTKDGLVDNHVRGGICGGADGVIWFGTGGGISRYDGKRFVNFTRKDGLVGYYVTSICRGADGVMWFGTEEGVSRYDGKDFVNFTTKNGLISGINAIYCAPDGVMWFGTGSGGVSRYDGKGFINFTVHDGLAHNSVRAIYQDAYGTIWFGTRGGVSRYDRKDFLNLTTKDGLARNRVLKLYRDSDGVMWFGTAGGGISRYDGKSFLTLTTKDGLADARVDAIYRDPSGVM